MTWLEPFTRHLAQGGSNLVGCLGAGPAGAYRRGAAFALPACAAHRDRERNVAQPCDQHCRSRSACVVGTAHADGPEEQRNRHRSSLPDVRAWLARRG